MAAPAEKTLKGNILIIDDEEDIRENIAFLLKRQGFNVTTSDDSEKALMLLKDKNQFNVVIVDLQMPKIDGNSFITQAKAHNKTNTLKYILITGDINYNLANSNADNVLYKPFNKKNLIDTISHFL